MPFACVVPPLLDNRTRAPAQSIIFYTCPHTCTLAHVPPRPRADTARLLRRRCWRATKQAQQRTRTLNGHGAPALHHGPKAHALTCAPCRRAQEKMLLNTVARPNAGADACHAAAVRLTPPPASMPTSASTLPPSPLSTPPSTPPSTPRRCHPQHPALAAARAVAARAVAPPPTLVAQADAPPDCTWGHRARGTTTHRIAALVVCRLMWRCSR